MCICYAIIDDSILYCSFVHHAPEACVAPGSQCLLDVCGPNRSLMFALNNYHVDIYNMFTLRF